MQLFELIRNKGLAPGQLVVSISGHDKGRLALIVGGEGRRVELVNGKHSFWQKPKRKNVNHVKPLMQVDADTYRGLLEMEDIQQRNAATAQLIRQLRATVKSPGGIDV